jgi:biopolymer transport protein ExbB
MGATQVPTGALARGRSFEAPEFRGAMNETSMADVTPATPLTPRRCSQIGRGLALLAGALPAVARAQDAPIPNPTAPDPTGGTLAGGVLGHLPHDLSPWNMFIEADVVVKAVIVSLAFASVVTWTVLVAKTLELAAAKRKIRAGLEVLGAVRSLREAGQQFQRRRCAIAALVGASLKEVALSAELASEGVKDRVASRLERVEAATARLATRGTGLLATIGSTAPFVGLFGTVWGIMNSFIGISKADTTNLAVVAPGIAQALLATAFGLFAAIPAVVIYNHFARAIAGYKALVADAAAEVLRLVSRDLDRQQGEVALTRVAE